jgi:hypothetical protein
MLHLQIAPLVNPCYALLHLLEALQHPLVPPRDCLPTPELLGIRPVPLPPHPPVLPLRFCPPRPRLPKRLVMRKSPEPPIHSRALRLRSRSWPQGKECLHVPLGILSFPLRAFGWRQSMRVPDFRWRSVDQVDLDLSLRRGFARSRLLRALSTWRHALLQRTALCGRMHERLVVDPAGKLEFLLRGGEWR